MILHPLRITCPICKSEAQTTDVMVADTGEFRVEAKCDHCKKVMHADFSLIEVMAAIAGEKGGIN